MYHSVSSGPSRPSATSRTVTANEITVTSTPAVSRSSRHISTSVYHQMVQGSRTGPDDSPPWHGPPGREPAELPRLPIPRATRALPASSLLALHSPLCPFLVTSTFPPATSLIANPI